MKDNVHPKFKAIQVLSILITLASLLSACTMTSPSPQQSEGPAVTPQPSETATPAPTPTLTPIPRYQVSEPGDAFTAQQEAINNSQSASAQKARIQRWLDYWVKFDNRPFAWESTALQWKYIYDNAENPREVLVILEVLGVYEGRLFTVPLVDGALAEFPPEYDGGEIEAGFGPLELPSGEEGLWLSVTEGIPVRRDAKGQIVEKLDMESGEWVEVEKYPIDLEKLVNFPQSYEYLVAHPEEFVEAPNPLEDIDVFNQWWNEKFVPILGDRNEREKNMIMSGGGVLGDFFDIVNYLEGSRGPKPIEGQPEMLFFKHEGVIYPIAIINVAYESDIATNFTMAIILVNENVSKEREALVPLANGEKIERLRIYLTKLPEYPGIRHELFDVGIKGEFSEEDKLIFGPGLIITTP